MAPLLRCEIRWADIDSVAQVRGREQGNRRPALILSNDRFNATSSLVIVALISASQANVNRPHSMQIQSVQMPAQPSWVLVDQIRTLSAERMSDYIGTMAQDEFTQVVRRIFALMHQ